MKISKFCGMYRFEFRANYDCFPIIEKIIIGDLREWPIKRKNSVTSCLIEALKNAIKYGNKNKGDINLLYSKDNSKLTIIIRDEGEGFDVSNLSNCKMPSVEADHGRGIPIIKKISDELKYNKRGNLIYMTFYKHSSKRT